MNGGHFAHTVDVHPDARLFGHLLHPDALGGAVDHVQLAGLEADLAAAEVRHVVVFDDIYQRPAAEVILVGHQHDLLRGRVALKHEGACPHGVGLEGFGAHGLISLLADDEPAGIVGYLGEEEHRRNRLLHRDLDSVVIHLSLIHI